jgi:ABC-type uncharacterized transport system auxiliary subunit
LIIKPKNTDMKKLLIIGGFIFTLAACGNGSESAKDSTTNPSDTTNLQINPATEDPNSNMADTMHMTDSSRVKDTSVKDKTSVTPRKQ